MAQLGHEAAMRRPTKQLARSSLASPPYLRLLLQALSNPKHAINLTAVQPSRGFQLKAAPETLRFTCRQLQPVHGARGLCTLKFRQGSRGSQRLARQSSWS